MRLPANWRNCLQAMLVMLAGLAAWSTPTLAQEEPGSRFWAAADLGSAWVESRAPAPSAGRKAIATSMEVGFRFTPQLGLGFEYGGVLPLGGCTAYGCSKAGADFAPNFTRLIAFGEFRPRDSSWRIRAGAGESRFCHTRHWDDSAWGWLDAVAVVVFRDDDSSRGSGAYHCDSANRAFGGMVSVGYDWSQGGQGNGSRSTVGWRLSFEAADFDATPSIHLPAFRHRAVMLTLHLSTN